MNIRCFNGTRSVQYGIASTNKFSSSRANGSFDELLTGSSTSMKKNTSKQNGITIQRPGVSIELHTQGTYQQRLDAISKLNAETDWDSLSDVEKVRVFEDRYKEAFPDYDVMSAGIYTTFSVEHQDVLEHCDRELKKYISLNGSKYTDNYREAYYPNMTNEEVRSAIQEKYSNTGCMEEKMVILEEIIRCNVDTGIEGSMLLDLHRQLNEQAWKKCGSSIIGDQINPRYLSGLMAFAKGIGDGANYRPNWTQLTQNMMQFNKDHGRYSKDELLDIQSKLDEFLNDLLH